MTNTRYVQIISPAILSDISVNNLSFSQQQALNDFLQKNEKQGAGFFVGLEMDRLGRAGKPEDFVALAEQIRVVLLHQNDHGGTVAFRPFIDLLKGFEPAGFREDQQQGVVIHQVGQGHLVSHGHDQLVRAVVEPVLKIPGTEQRRAVPEKGDFPVPVDQRQQVIDHAAVKRVDKGPDPAQLV